MFNLNSNQDVFISITSHELSECCLAAIIKIKALRRNNDLNMETRFQEQYNNSWLNKKSPKFMRRKDISLEETKELLREQNRDWFSPYPNSEGLWAEGKSVEILGAIKGMSDDTSIMISSKTLSNIKSWLKEE